MPSDVSEESRHGENGAGRQPATHVVSADMIQHGVVGNLEDIVLKLLQTVYAQYLGARLGVTEDEIAETHVLLHQSAQVQAHLFRVLVHKAEALGLSTLAVLTLRTLHNERHILVAGMDGTQELDAGLRIFLSIHGEASVADHTEHIARETLVDTEGFFIGTGENHLGTAAHAQGGSVTVEGLGGETLTLKQDVIVEVGEDRTVKPDAVFDKQYHLHTTLQDVMFQIHLVLHELDDGEDEIGIAQPAEDIVEDGEILVLHAPGDTMRERGKHDTVQVGETLLDGAGHGKGIVVGIARHTEHQVDIGGLQYLLGLLDGAHLREGWRIAETQLHVLVVDLLLDAPVVFEHESIVRIGHDQHIVDAAHHQVDKTHIFQIKVIPLRRYFIVHDSQLLCCKDSAR